MDYKLELAKQLDINIDVLSVADILNSLEVPSNSDLGDFAFPCFKLAKAYKKAPPVIAQELKESLSDIPFIEKVEATGPYLNFFVKKSDYVQKIVSEVLEKGEDFGSSSLGEGKLILIDYSSPNICKPFHVGHLRSTLIGSALIKIHKKLGYDTFGINYLGDWGTQFGKLIVAYKKWGNKEDVERDEIVELTRLYVKFHDEADKDESLNDEARAWLLKMQNNDKEAIELWQWFKDISIKEYDRIYDRLGVTFDNSDGESFYNDKMTPIVDELREKDLLVESNGAQIVDLDEFNLPPCLILRSDGGTLYPTRDLAAAKYRKEHYNFYKALYLTGADQKLHFAQWFRVIELMGYDWYKDLEHVAFGMVSLEQGKLSTRKGHVVLMEDLLDEAVKKTYAIINEKNPNLPNKEQTAEDVGIGAVIFNDLFNGRVKDVVFSWDRMLNFDGETGPYVQYTHARACSVLNKGNYDENAKVNYDLLSDPESLELAKLFDGFNDRLVLASEKSEPYIVTRHVVEIAKAFNKFYHENIILVEDTELKNARLAIVKATKDTLKMGLELLGINAPTSM